MRKRKKKNRIAISPDEDILKVINRVVKQSHADKYEFYEAMDHTYAWYAGDKNEIYKGGSVDAGGQEDDPRHFPLLWSYVENLTALIAGEISPYYIGKFAQGKEYLGDIGNALFDAIRNVIGWDAHVADIFQQIILFQGCVAGPYIDNVKFFPGQQIGLRMFSPRQFHCTRKRQWDEAPERVLCYQLEKSELEMLYPKHAKEIRSIAGMGDDDYGYTEGSQKDPDKITLNGPKMFGTGKSSDNAVNIREAWLRDFASHVISDKEDYAKIIHEQDEILSAIESGAPPETLTWIDTWDIDAQHIATHEELLQSIQSGDFGAGSDDLVGEVAEQLMQHIDDHKYQLERTPPSRVGVKYSYEDGWRYMVVADQKVVLEDGPNPYLEYGIKEPPLAYFWMCKDPLNTIGKSWANQIEDLGATISSIMNDAEYMIESRQGTIIYQQDSVDPKSITNDGRIPIMVFKGKNIQESIQTLPAGNLPPQMFDFVQSLRSFLEESAGLYQAARGGRPPGVRSAEQLQGMITQNESSLQYKPRLIKPSFIKYATWVWQMEVSIGLDDPNIKPIMDEVMIAAEIDELEDLESAPFSVGIKLKNGPTTTEEDRRMLVEQIIPALRADFQDVPTAGVEISNLYAEVYGEDWPQMKRTIKKLQAAKEQAIAEAQAAQEAAALAAQGQQLQNMQQLGGAAQAQPGPEFQIA